MNSPARIFAFLAALLFLPGCKTGSFGFWSKHRTETPPLQSGDIVFQDCSPRSSQSIQIKELTQSQWSHCGIYFELPGKGSVVVDGDGMSPLASWKRWKSHGDGGACAAFRLTSGLSSGQIARLWNTARNYDHRPYDLKFSWDDKSIYCSELVGKAYHEALGIELAKLSRLKDFDPNTPAARALIERRGGWETLENFHAHSGEAVISPQALTESPLLHRVH